MASAFDLPARPVRRAACDIIPVALQTFATRYGWQTEETSWEKLVQREDIHLVDICTSNDLQMPIAVAAAKAGKHVLCEKPVARNADEARRMLDAAEEAGVRHMVGFNYRRVPALALARRLIELQLHSRHDAGPEQGFRNILVTESDHSFIAAWWPPGHIIGWEHTFVHEIRDLLVAIAEGHGVQPDFLDGLRCQQVLDTIQASACQNKWLDVPQ